MSDNRDEYEYMQGPICSDCRKPCETVEETFDYAGTHCTHGLPGTHHTGHYVSKCCHGELEEI